MTQGPPKGTVNSGTTSTSTSVHGKDEEPTITKSDNENANKYWQASQQARQGPPEIKLLCTHRTGNLNVEVQRSDGFIFSNLVTIEIKGPESKTSKRDPNSAHQEFKYRQEFKYLLPGEYTVTINHNEANNRLRRTEPDSTTMPVAVKASQDTTVKYVLEPKYPKIQFVGYYIFTGIGQDPKYLGSDDPAKHGRNAEAATEHDIQARCQIMTEAIRQAHAQANGDSDVLKVFMAPEFYFRGLQGAYPLETLSGNRDAPGIIDRMHKETIQEQYKDWLFVYGSALGYLKGDKPCAKSEGEILDITKGNLLIKSATLVQKGYYLQQGDVRDFVTTVKRLTYDCYQVTVLATSKDKFKVSDKVTIVDPAEVEVFNIAFVQKGGQDTPISADGCSGLKEALIYKEYISQIDFLGPGFDNFMFTANSMYRLIDIAGEWQRAIPTVGSRDLETKQANRPGDTVQQRTITEINKSGLGGGSIFTIDDITFGLEVCVDHGKGRLANFYANGGGAASGDPKVQVQLLPSCGISIKNRYCTPDGLIFNVDAQHCVAQIQGGNASLKAESVTPLTSAVTSFSTYFDEDENVNNGNVKTSSKYGYIVVYPVQDTPHKATV